MTWAQVLDGFSKINPFKCDPLKEGWSEEVGVSFAEGNIRD